MATERRPQIAVSWTVANRGVTVAKPSWTDAVYLSTNDVWEVEDPILTWDWQNIELLPGGEYRVTHTVTFAAGLFGSYHFILRLNTYGDLYESAPENNIVVRPFQLVRAPVPDLLITDITGPIEAVSGQPVQISWVISNPGPAEAVGPWTQAVALAAPEHGQ